ncbi:hypothetical protein JTB14_010180 [Gonioctena quinquepunctata]|nr:hypothetical protein JTB14_010180 [Gonioctena quinquepunctata]
MTPFNIIAEEGPAFLEEGAALLEGGAASLEGGAASLQEGVASLEPYSHRCPRYPGASPSHAFLSPEDYRDYPKAGERKTDRKQRKKGKSMIATNTPEMEVIAEKEKLIPTSRILQQKEEDDEEDDGDVEYADTDDDMDIDEEIFAVEPDQSRIEPQAWGTMTQHLFFGKLPLKVTHNFYNNGQCIRFIT